MKFCLVLLLGLTLTGCFSARKEAALKEQIWKLRNRVSHLEQKFQKRESKLSYLEKASTEARTLLNSARSNLQVSRSSVEYMKGEMEEVRIKLDRDIDVRLRQIEKELTDLNNLVSSGRVASAPTPKPKKIPVAKKKSEPPQVTYKKARAEFQRKNYKRVVQLLYDFDKKHSSFRSMDEILYLKAESHYRLKDYRSAALSFNQVLEKFTKSVFAPVSQMRMGDCYRILGDKNMAKIYFSEFLKKYSRSKYRGEVQKKLSRLTKKKK